MRSIIGELTGKQFDFEEDWDPAAYEFNLKPSQATAGVRALGRTVSGAAELERIRLCDDDLRLTIGNRRGRSFSIVNRQS